MSFTFTLGWWLAPALLTVGVFGWFAVWMKKQPSASGYGAIGAGLGAALMLGFALILSLVAWLIYFVALAI